MDYTAQTWTEFMNSGMLWFVNRILHIFGWVIVVEVDTVGGCVTKVWPARTKVLGFTPEYDAECQKKFLCHVRDQEQR